MRQFIISIHWPPSVNITLACKFYNQVRAHTHTHTHTNLLASKHGEWSSVPLDRLQDHLLKRLERTPRQHNPLCKCGGGATPRPLSVNNPLKSAVICPPGAPRSGAPQGPHARARWVAESGKFPYPDTGTRWMMLRQRPQV